MKRIYIQFVTIMGLQRHNPVSDRYRGHMKHGDLPHTSRMRPKTTGIFCIIKSKHYKKA